LFLFIIIYLLSEIYKCYPKMKKIISSRFKDFQFYIISAGLFIVWLVFFDRSSLLTQIDLAMDLKNLAKEKAFYESELESIKKEEKAILGDMNSLEKFAREKYLMKKEGETVFVLVDEDNEPIKEE
jgi:cell division protein DivIC